MDQLKDYSALLQPAISNPQPKKICLYVSHIYTSHPSRKCGSQAILAAKTQSFQLGLYFDF